MKAPRTEPQDIDLDGLDDFDSAEFEDHDTDDTYLRGMWGRVSRVGVNLEQRTLVAHAMVESFVNAFARDGHYDVRFDSSIPTAGTEMDRRVVRITTTPITDQEITAEQAGLILTGLAVHEISHPRYGRETAEAVKARFASFTAAHTVSNLLDDIRIERRFVDDYPGYAGVFAPTLEYVGTTTFRRTGKRPQSAKSPVQRMIDATRYDQYVDWLPEHEADRAWWQAWADRWSTEDSPRRHAEGVREALVHIVDEQDRQEREEKAKAAADAKAAAGADQEPGEGASGSPESDESSEDGSSPTTPGADRLKDTTLAIEAGKSMRDGMDETRPACSGATAVDEAGTDSSKGQSTTTAQTAQAAIDLEKDTVDIGGTRVDVSRSLRGISRGRLPAPVNNLASRHIAAAINRSRTGHERVDTFQKRGRLDGRGLHRTGLGDVRVFERRTAPSPGRYLVWVMVDCSSSMDGAPITEVTKTAHAFAVAGRGIPSVRMAVWGWTTGLRKMGQASVVKAWETGEDPGNVLNLWGAPRHSTPDNQTMRWATKAIKAATRGSEKPVIVFLSDGEGDQGPQAMDIAVAEARREGIEVIGVGYSTAVTEDTLVRRFGKGRYVPFRGSVEATSKPLADIIANVVSK